MKKYIWGSYKRVNYSLIEVDESNNQVVLRPIGTKTHLTLHTLEVLRKTSKFYFVKYQNEIQKLSKKQFIPMSWDLSDPILKNTWSDETVKIARKKGFSNPEKHAYSVQNLIGVNAKNGCHICSIRIGLNNSTKKGKYLNVNNKIGVILMSKDNLIIEFVFIPQNNEEFKKNYSFIVNTKLGKIYLIINQL